MAADTQLAQTIRTYDETHPIEPVDVALVHDPTAATPLDGVVPLVLAGHLHKREVRKEGGTKILVEGTTGGRADHVRRTDQGRDRRRRAADREPALLRPVRARTAGGCWRTTTSPSAGSG